VAKNEIDYSIANFPYICSNILAVPVYLVYIFQLIRYSTAELWFLSGFPC